MMNLGPPPPPPPPPFSTGAPAPAPAPKPPAEVPSKAPPPVAIPAALAGAMMKEKKPFTYTPGGLNLAEIKSPRMQRRLQRNASLEGVRPSPLAQQPPQSPGTGPSAAASIPLHGMIQVLPMPGMGMTPVVKPQPKEPPKPKRNVCGPAPPPPPFSIFGENSMEPSPCVTPPTTPASSSGVSSASTSALSSQSSCPVSNSNSLETDEQLKKEKIEMAAEQGSYIPSPPPLPPSSSASYKRCSLPSLSSQQSSSCSRPESESLQSSLSTFSSPQTASKSPTDLTQNENENIQINTSAVDEMSKSRIEEDIVIPSLPDEKIHQDKQVLDETVESHKEISSLSHDQESKSVIKINEEHKQPNSAEIASTKEDEKNMLIKLDHEINSNNKEEFRGTENVYAQTNLEQKTTISDNSNSNSKILQETIAPPQASVSQNESFVCDNVQTNVNISNNTTTPSEANLSLNKSFVQDIVQNCDNISKTTTTQPQASVNTDKNFVHDNIQTNEIVLNKNQESENVFSPITQESSRNNKSSIHEVTNEIGSKKTQESTKTIETPLKRVNTTNNNVSFKPNECLQSNTSAISSAYQPSPVIENRNQNSVPYERVQVRPVENKPSMKAKEPHQYSTPNVYQSNRPGVRMASPPSEVKRGQDYNYDRLSRQASLPAEPNVPQVNPNKGSIYIPPVRQISSDSGGQSRSTPNSAQCSSSSPTGLIKAPLPWMCGVRKEPSPPPEFLIYAQKAQDRIQRQRSLNLQDNNQQFSQSKRNDIGNLQQNGYFQPSSPYSSTPNLSNSNETNKTNDAHLQYNWRLPTHQSGHKIQQQQQKSQQIPQQKGRLPNFSQPQVQIKQQNQQNQHNKQNQQPRFSQFPHQQSMTLPKNHPRERIIPIMMEDSSPLTPSSNVPMSGGTINFQNKMNNSYQPIPQRQQSWPKPSSVPSSPMGVNAAFSPYDEANFQTSSTAIEALQQMQQNLAKLNCGLQTAQTPGQQNGAAPFVIQHGGANDPVQSRSFKMLQNAYDHQDPSGPPMEVTCEPKKYAGSNIPSRSFRMLQTMTAEDGPGPGESDL